MVLGYQATAIDMFGFRFARFETIEAEVKTFCRLRGAQIGATNSRQELGDLKKRESEDVCQFLLRQ